METSSANSAAILSSKTASIGFRARRRVAWRILPLAFLLYVISYIDRVNVSFAALRMNADLGFGDRVFGLGVGIFYVGYVLLEIPGSIMVERWSARKWIARIMISWGLVTILTGFVHSAGQFYAVRLFLGVAEASFLPGMIVYLSHWFRLRERSRAIACLYAAVPTASLLGSPLAGWLLGVHWGGLAGWRWLFIVEGAPAIVVGIVTFFYMTDWPAQARWLPPEEREWLANELQAELRAKKKIRDYTILQAFCDRRVLFLMAAWFLALAGSLGNVYWIPTFVKRLSGFSDRSVTTLLLIPALVGIAGTLLNGWHSDKSGERRWHAAGPLLAAGLMYGLLLTSSQHTFLALSILLLASGFFYAFLPVCWSIPTMIFSGAAAAATFGLINSIGQLGGLAGPYLIGLLNDRTHSLAASFGFISFAYIVAGSLLLRLKIRNPVDTGTGESS